MAGAGADPTTPLGVWWPKTADELGIEDEVYDAITTILGSLKRGELVYATDENTIPHGINMANRARDLTRWIKSRRPGMKLPLSLDPLIHPQVTDLGSLTAEDIIAAIDSYLKTGVPCWRGAKIEPIRSQAEPAQPRPEETQLDAAIKKRWDDGERPSENVKWKVFRENLIDDCAARTTVMIAGKRKENLKRGFSLRHIQRRITKLKKSKILV
jgi:hypothetical protein